MSERAPRHALRDALRGPDTDDRLDWLTGVVAETRTSSTPYAVRVQLADGSRTGWIAYLASYTPSVGHVVEVLRKGPKLLVLGSVAPPPTGSLVTPPTPPTVTTVNISPTELGCWRDGAWVDQLVQGDPDGRVFWFYGSAITALRSSGATITGGSIYVRRLAGSLSGGSAAARVRLGVHGFTTRPVSDGAPLADVSVQAQLLRDRDAAVPLSDAHVAALNTSAVGLGLEPGGSAADVLGVARDGASGQLSLTIQQPG